MEKSERERRGRRGKSSLAEIQLAQHMAAELENALTLDDRTRLLLSSHIFIGAVGYFSGAKTRALIDEEEAENGDEEDGLFEKSWDGNKHGDGNGNGNGDGNRDGNGNTEEEEEEEEGEEMAVRFIVGSLGNSLDPANVVPVQLADLGM
jgi:hypothetical protein